MPTSDQGSSGWFDSHCHLDQLADAKRCWREAEQQGLDNCFIPAIRAVDWPHLARFKEQGYLIGAGTHPWYVSEPVREEALLRDQLSTHQVAAVGEIGLDFHPSKRQLRPPRSIQLSAFSRQLGVATEAGLPTVLHVVKAHQECLQALSSLAPLPAVVHAFSGSLDIGQQYIDRGLLLGIGPAVLGSPKLQQALTCIQPTHIVLETDVPYMSRHGTNPLIDLFRVAQKLSELWQLDLATVKATCTANAERLFGRKLSRVQPAITACTS